MARPKPGERVGAILCGRPDGSMDFLGYGTYAGDEVPPDEGGGSLTGMLAENNVSNPKIVLDNGDVVWGCECWWGPEEQIRREVDATTARNREVRQVRIGKARKKDGN